jgi:hypothetical protein
MKIELSRHIFQKFSTLKFHENPSRESRVVLRGKTDRHFEACSRFSQFCERATNCQLLSQCAEVHTSQNLRNLEVYKRLHKIPTFELCTQLIQSVHILT